MFFFLEIVLSIIDPFIFCIHIGINLSISTPKHTYKPIGIWIGVAFNVQINLGQFQLVTILSLLIHEHGLSLHLSKGLI